MAKGKTSIFSASPAGTLAKQKATASEAKVLPLSQIEMTYDKRVSTDMKELDRVLGGGIVQGSMVLVGGDPGIGKSTLLLQVCRNLSAHNIKVLYISGEESLQQIKIRAERIGNFGDSLKSLVVADMQDAEIIQRGAHIAVVYVTAKYENIEAHYTLAFNEDMKMASFGIQ